VFRIGPYEFRRALKVLNDPKQKKIRLTEKGDEHTEVLYRNQPRPGAPRDELLTEVWGYNGRRDHAHAETHVYRLRQKIEPEPQQARLLLTEAGGYRLAP
jgi:DNA-binding response OmpR family regulator